MKLKAKIQKIKFALIPFLLFSLTACGQKKGSKLTHTKVFQEMNATQPVSQATSAIDTATFAAGCFWCVQAQFSQLKGVKKIINGFAGGHTVNPTYRTVSTGTTGYAETCNILYNPAVISYRELLAAFFIAHDPTQLNRQGNDVGTQYRSAIFFHNPKQKKQAHYYIKKLNQIHAYPKDIVTQVVPYTRFYPAKELHQDYYFKHPDQPYCQMVIKPEMKRFKKVFHEKLKDKDNPYYSRTDTTKLDVSKATWKKILPAKVYHIAFERGTERPFKNKYWNYKGKGTYYCAVCGNKLFYSTAKFASSCGWPSFFKPARKNAVIYKQDHRLGMDRTEVICERCGAHLGHVFHDGPPPTGLRYCMNSLVLDFVPNTVAITKSE